MTQGQIRQNVFNRVVSVISKYLFYIGVGAVAVSGAMTTIDVVARYFLKKPIPGAYQLQEMLLVTLITLPLAYCQEKRIHVRVDILLGRLKGKARSVFELSNVIIALVLFGLAAWTTGQAAWQSFVTKDFYVGTIHYPYWPSKTMLALGTGFLCLRLLIDVTQHGRDLFRRV